VVATSFDVRRCLSPLFFLFFFLDDEIAVTVVATSFDVPPQAPRGRETAQSSPPTAAFDSCFLVFVLPGDEIAVTVVATSFDVPPQAPRERETARSSPATAVKPPSAASSAYQAQAAQTAAAYATYPPAPPVKAQQPSESDRPRKFWNRF